MNDSLRRLGRVAVVILLSLGVASGLGLWIALAVNGVAWPNNTRQDRVDDAAFAACMQRLPARQAVWQAQVAKDQASIKQLTAAALQYAARSAAEGNAPEPDLDDQGGWGTNSFGDRQFYSIDELELQAADRLRQRDHDSEPVCLDGTKMVTLPSPSTSTG
jgi:hypothetical protein